MKLHCESKRGWFACCQNGLSAGKCLPGNRAAVVLLLDSHINNQILMDFRDIVEGFEQDLMDFSSVWWSVTC